MNKGMQRWEDAGFLDCGSAQELVLRISVTGLKPATAEDLAELAEAAAADDRFCSILAETIRTTDALDEAVTAVEYYIDYYFAVAAGGSPDPADYGHLRVLDLYKSGVLEHTAKYGRAYIRGREGSEARLRALADLMSACSDKANALLGGRYKSISSFKNWLAAHREP